MKDRDNITLSTGRVIYANRGILGLVRGGDSNQPQRLTLTEGYDGDVWVDVGEYDHDKDGKWRAHGGLTKAEREEIAALMISLWREWAESEDKYEDQEPNPLTKHIDWVAERTASEILQDIVTAFVEMPDDSVTGRCLIVDPKLLKGES